MRGFLATRRYWGTLVKNPRTAKILLLGALKLPVGMVFTGGGMTAAVLLLNISPAWLGMVLSTSVFLASIATCSLMLVTDPWLPQGQKAPAAWRRYSEVLHLAIAREALAVMDLRVVCGVIVDSKGTRFGIIDPDKTKFEIYIPTQAHLVSRIALRDSRHARAYVRTLFHTTGDRLCAAEGMQRLFQTAFLYQATVAARGSAPQVGFGGMLLQQGDAAVVLYNMLAVARYATLSWHGVEPANMAGFADAPDFLVGSLYLDGVPDWHSAYLQKVSSPSMWLNYYGDNHTYDDAYDPRAIQLMLAEYREHIPRQERVTA